MSRILTDRAMEVSTTTGSGPMTLAGAVTGYVPLNTFGTSDGDTGYYIIEAVDAAGLPTGAWETGLGTWRTGEVWERTSVHQSSNGGSAVVWAAGTKRVSIGWTAGQFARVLTCIPVACSDETTALTVGTGKITFRMPFAMTLTAIRASVNTAPTGGTLLAVDVNQNGTTILAAKLTFDAGEKTTNTAASPPGIANSVLADDAEITVDIDAVGSTIAGAGLKVYLVGYVT